MGCLSLRCCTTTNSDLPTTLEVCEDALIERQEAINWNDSYKLLVLHPNLLHFALVKGIESKILDLFTFEAL